MSFSDGLLRLGLLLLELREPDVAPAARLRFVGIDLFLLLMFCSVAERESLRYAP